MVQAEDKIQRIITSLYTRKAVEDPVNVVSFELRSLFNELYKLGGLTHVVNLAIKEFQAILEESHISYDTEITVTHIQDQHAVLITDQGAHLGLSIRFKERLPDLISFNGTVYLDSDAFIDALLKYAPTLKVSLAHCIEEGYGGIHFVWVIDTSHQ